jgi:hypothetical protein
VFSLKHEAKDAKKWISDVKFTPDGKTAAVSCLKMVMVSLQKHQHLLTKTVVTVVWRG